MQWVNLGWTHINVNKGKEIIEKKCCICKEVMEISNFYNYKASKDGKMGRCKTCDDKARKKWRANNPDRAWESQRRNALMVKYGITLEEYNSILKLQGGCCAICKSREPRSLGNARQSFSVDHCHVSGHIRGLLCNNCNRALGLLGDTVTSIKKAYTYVVEAEKNPYLICKKRGVDIRGKDLLEQT